MLPYPVSAGPNGDVRLNIGDKQYPPPEISAMILQKIKAETQDKIGDGVFEVKSTAGDNHLGGDNWDKAIVDWLVAEFKKDQGVDLAADKNSLQRLYEAAEKAKIELSSAQETQINLPFITAVEVLG